MKEKLQALLDEARVEIQNYISGMTQIVELSSRPIKGKSHSVDDFQANAGMLRIQIKGFYICTNI